MPPFIALDQYLSQNFPPDYWFDDAYAAARQSVSQFAPADWTELRLHWPSRAPAWQRRCAYALHGSPSPDAVALLLEMLRSPYDDVAMQAMEALRSVEELPLPIPDHAITRLRQLLTTAEGADAEVLQQLLARFERA
jgi:hypothetical protein